MQPRSCEEQAKELRTAFEEISFSISCSQERKLKEDKKTKSESWTTLPIRSVLVTLPSVFNRKKLQSSNSDSAFKRFLFKYWISSNLKSIGVDLYCLNYLKIYNYFAPSRLWCKLNPLKEEYNSFIKLFL